MIKFQNEAPIRLPLTIATPEEGDELIRRGEAAFEARLNACAAAISEDCITHGVRVIRLAGPTCAGKSPAAEKLTEALEAKGRVVYPISIDDFYYGRDVLHAQSEEAGEHLDYDSVKTIDLPCLATVVQDLIRTGSAEIPQFNFLTGYRDGYRTLTVPDGVQPVFLFEGIQAVYPEVTALFEGVSERSLFIHPMQEIILVDGEGRERVFGSADIRLLRRLVRDEAKRGSYPDFTLFLWHSVRANEENAIFPNAVCCDYGLDSNMQFDIHILVPHLRRIFAEHPCDGDEVATERAILASIEGVTGISDKALSPKSLYREFIVK